MEDPALVRKPPRHAVIPPWVEVLLIVAVLILLVIHMVRA